MRAYRTLLAMAAFAVSMNSFAQSESQLKNLTITNITPELSVYPCGDRHEALVILRCQEPFDLILASNYDANLDLSVTQEGPEKVYSIVFKTKEEGTSFKGRQLTVVAEGFKKHYIPLNLSDKEKLEFLVSDPYSKLRSLFYTATEEGISFMSDGQYDAAIDKFRIAMQCPEFTEVENHLEDYIVKCDTLKSWTARAAQYSENEDYFMARSVYMNILRENPNCQIARELYTDANENFNRVSAHDMQVAQAYYETKRYEEARALYEHAIAQNNPQSAQAGINLADIKLRRYKKDNHTRSLSYVFEKNAPIGLMTANLKPDKTSGYFAFGFDKGCIDILSKNADPVTALDATTGKVIPPAQPMYQASVNAGWTLRLYTQGKEEYIPKVWALLSPFGYATGGYYSKINISGENATEPEYEESYHMMHAIAPEAGVAIRIWRVVLSYRLQYRYMLNKEKPVSDELGKTRNMLGIGICW
ncbi:MAG: tetratricopeptide repeat protein [Bacteroidaceae bacterium]|nr:tetratricopeptide repeat protein [Bacteroidaceae bacterium]